MVHQRSCDEGGDRPLWLRRLYSVEEVAIVGRSFFGVDLAGEYDSALGGAKNSSGFCRGRHRAEQRRRWPGVLKEDTLEPLLVEDGPHEF